MCDLEDFRQGLRNVQKELEQQHRELMEVILHNGVLTTAGGALQGTSENIIQATYPASLILSHQTTELPDEKKRQQLMDQAVQKGRIIKALASALSQKPFQDKWQPLIEYFRQCNENGAPLRASVVEELVEEVLLVISPEASRSPSEISIQGSDSFVCKSPSASNVNVNQNNYDTPQVKKSKKTVHSPALRTAIIKLKFEEKDSLSIRGLWGSSEELNNQLVGCEESSRISKSSENNKYNQKEKDKVEEDKKKLENEGKKAFKLKRDFSVQTESSGSLYELCSEKGSKDYSIEATGMTAYDTGVDKDTNSKPFRDKSIDAVSIPAFNTVPSNQDNAILQRQAYVVSRIEELHRKLEDNAKISRNLQNTLISAANDMKDRSEYLLTCLEKLDNDLTSLGNIDYENIVEDMKAKIAIDVRRNSSILVAMEAFEGEERILQEHAKLLSEAEEEKVGVDNARILQKVAKVEDLTKTKDSFKIYKSEEVANALENKEETLSEVSLSDHLLGSEFDSEDDAVSENLSFTHGSLTRMSISGPGAKEWLWQKRISDEDAAVEAALFTETLLEAAETVALKVLGELEGKSSDETMDKFGADIDQIIAEMKTTDLHLVTLKKELQNLVQELAERLSTMKLSVPSEAFRFCSIAQEDNCHEASIQMLKNEPEEGTMMKKIKPEIEEKGVFESLENLKIEMKNSDEQVSTIRKELLNLERDLKKKVQQRFRHRRLPHKPLDGFSMDRFATLKNQLQYKISMVQNATPCRNLPISSAQVINRKRPTPVEIKKLNSNFIKVSWRKPRPEIGDDIVAYEVQLEGKTQHKVRNPERLWAVLEDTRKPRKISIVAETISGRRILVASSHPVYDLRIDLTIPK